jgi:glutathione S-transferase
MLIRGLAATPEKIAGHIKGCSRAFAQLDEQLAGRDYICGDDLTVADIVIGAMMYRYMTLDIDRPALANLDAWYQRLTERPAYQYHVMLEYGSNVEEWDVFEAANADIQ